MTETTETTGKYISMQKASMTLDCTDRHIYDLVIAGELIAIRIGIGKDGTHGRAVRILKKSLDEFLERRKINPEDMFDQETEEEKEPQPPRIVARSKFINR